MQEEANHFLKSIRSYSKLFDRERYGINLSVGIAFLTALFLARIVWILWLPGLSGLLFLSFAKIYFSGFIVDIVISLAFVTISHSVTNNSLLPIVYGLVFALIKMGSRAIQPVFHFPVMDQMRLPLPFDIQYIVTDLLFGLCFMAGLMVAVKMWGIRLWSLTAGVVGSYLIYYILVKIFSYIFFSHSLYVSPTPIAVNIVNSIILGTLLYGGFYVHFIRVLHRSRSIEP